ncbi:MAG TPA: alkaline phosphatase family protein [Solirubrobacterales bacterium]|nr:alkaline phosphatase family protein [Solirubrobacterales bacterium]
MEAEEREFLADPEGTLRRRDFLRRAAYTAGMAGAAMLPANQLLAESARAQALLSGASGSNTQKLNHFVVLCMENRSFDHYFGWYSDKADATQNRTYLDPDNGDVPVSTHHASTMGQAQWQGCGHPDPDHSWGGGRTQLGSARDNPNVEPDNFLEGDNDEFALTYYNEGDLGFIHAAGKAFQAYDRFHCSLMGPTWPNRYYKWSAQSGGRINNDPPASTLGNQWETLFDRALKDNPANLPDQGVTVGYYASDLPFSAVWGPRGVPWTRRIEQYYADCAAGTLPNIVFVDPPFRDGSGGDGLSADEHPLGDVRLGQAFMSDVVHAFLESPHWRHGAFFVVYDEWGGFWDHVRPQSVPDDRQSSNIDQDFGLMGYRIPGVALSPYAPRGQVSHLLCGFESIIKLITDRFGLGNLVTRDAQANNIGLSFDYDHPNFDVPDLPDPVAIASRPCSLGGGDAIQDSAQAHEGDLAALEDLAERWGFPVGSGDPSEIFRSPDSVTKALG